MNTVKNTPNSKVINFYFWYILLLYEHYHSQIRRNATMSLKTSHTHTFNIIQILLKKLSHYTTKPNFLGSFRGDNVTICLKVNYTRQEKSKQQNKKTNELTLFRENNNFLQFLISFLKLKRSK